MTGEGLKAYRRSEKLTQSQLALMLNSEVGARLDKPSISRMENGLYVIPENVEQYITNKIALKAVATSSDARKDDRWITIPNDIKKSLKSPFSPVVLRMLSSATKSRPLTRSEISKGLHITDRHTRRCIEELRMAGVRIASSSKHYGYWICKTEAEYQSFRAEYLAPAHRVLKTVAAMDRYVEGQLTWEEEHGLTVKYGTTYAN